MPNTSTLLEAAQNPTLGSLLSAINHGDTAARVSAVKQSVLVGTPAIVPLGQVAGGGEPAAARAATEALNRIVLHAGRPKADRERKEAVARLGELAQPTHPRVVRAQAVFLIGSIGRDEAVRPLTALLGDEQMREDARMALERVPGKAADAAIKQAEKTAPPDFKASLRLSIKHRATPMREIGARK